ncbi:hypothetical protein GCM10011575_32320 [Microlunatus endophyticus]|uniref:HTH marR-type domain-containing protein n=1 Tax=Microlunatus endophyticus TaxID=1716077 RepID=A0A917W5N5_9ACTN|nr:MarR family transcriptional regulator [Microlunatus endophyticus]GGL71532.1 hypothetical protein GCM10011575_32320 [Microlunatus endophyticus]
MSIDRPELGFLLNRLLREVIEREQPILDQHDLQMWDYVIIAALGSGPSPTQNELAGMTGRDKTRLIRNLDRLEERGLLSRTPDPGDRRNRIVTLTADGRQVLDSCRAGIRAMEEDLLAGADARDRAGFESALVALTRPPSR